jgi:hypothetical protein
LDLAFGKGPLVLDACHIERFAGGVSSGELRYSYAFNSGKEDTDFPEEGLGEGVLHLIGVQMLFEES